MIELVLFMIGVLGIASIIALLDWKKIKWTQLPKWVKKAESKWYSKLAHRPYDCKKYFVGKKYIYKFFYESRAQGEIIPHYYKKNKKLTLRYYLEIWK